MSPPRPRLLGMVPAASMAFIDLETGRIIGQRPALPAPPPAAPAPAPAPTRQRRPVRRHQQPRRPRRLSACRPGCARHACRSSRRRDPRGGLRYAVPPRSGPRPCRSTCSASCATSSSPGTSPISTPGTSPGCTAVGASRAWSPHPPRSVGHQHQPTPTRRGPPAARRSHPRPDAHALHRVVVHPHGVRGPTRAGAGIRRR